MVQKYKMREIGIVAVPIFLIFFILFIAGALEIAAASTIVVNGTCIEGNIYCDTIQEAVDMAIDGDTIIVCDGTYHENVVIDKPLILKASGNVTIEASDDSKEVVLIKANNVVFSGFNVKGGFAGVYLDNVRRCRVENNSVFENEFGIGLVYSRGNSILNNVAFKNEVTGIHLEVSLGNKVSNNIANKNLYSIALLRSNNNTIKNNTACENGDQGIQLQDSSENEVSNNTANKNLGGIILTLSHYN